MRIEEIDAQIELVKRRMQTTSSHLAKIEMQKQLLELEGKRKDAEKRASWEM